MYWPRFSGSGKSFDSAQQAVQGEAGRKGYNFHQRADKGQVGNFNKEREQKEYAEEGKFYIQLFFIIENFDNT